MLVVTIKKGLRILHPDGTEIIIKNMTNKHMRVAIDAPGYIEVRRLEITDRSENSPSESSNRSPSSSPV